VSCVGLLSFVCVHTCLGVCWVAVICVCTYMSRRVLGCCHLCVHTCLGVCWVAVVVVVVASVLLVLLVLLRFSVVKEGLSGLGRAM